MRIQKNFSEILIGLLVSVFLIGFTNSAIAATLYKWVDKNGNITYQDSPPPKGTEFEEQEYEDVPEEPDSNTTRAALLKPVSLFTVPNCESCTKVRKFLEKKQVPFFEKDAEGDNQAKDELRKIAGRLVVPLVSVGEGYWSGGSMKALAESLEVAGYELAPDEEPAESDAEKAAEAAPTAEAESEGQAKISSDAAEVE